MTTLIGVARKKTPLIQKPEVMENNMDAMEYSSEEETEDLGTTMANLAAAKKRVSSLHAFLYIIQIRICIR